MHAPGPPRAAGARARSPGDRPDEHPSRSRRPPGADTSAGRRRGARPARLAVAGPAALHGGTRGQADRSGDRHRHHRPDHPHQGPEVRGDRSEARDPLGGRGHRPHRAHGAPRPGGRPQPPGHHLQGHAGAEQLLRDRDLRQHAAAGDPGRIQRHPDARRGLHHRPRHGEQRPLRGHRPSASHRGGVDPRPADHQRGNHHRQRRRPVLAHAGDGHREEGHLPRVPRGGHPRRAR